MRRFILVSLLSAAGVAFTGVTADAQYRYRGSYRYVPGYGYRYVTPYPSRYAPVYPVAPAPIYPAPVPGYGVGGGADLVRSLYVQYLQREPDPQGMQTWLERLAVLGGDVSRLTQEFAQSAAIEQNANNPAYRLRSYP